MPLDHFVSQVHLKRFYAPSLGGKKMYAFRKSNGRTFPCGSEDVCRIADGNTNGFLHEPRLVENFLKMVEPRYNAACTALQTGKIDHDDIFVIAGFVAYVMTCSPAAMRLGAAPMNAMLPLELAMMERVGAFKDLPPPPTFEGKTITDLLREGELMIETDTKYPQAIGIRNIIGQLTAYGNFHWDILTNDHADNPFFTSDFPVAVEPSGNPIVVNRVIPLAPSLAIRICPRLELSGRKLPPTFEHFSYQMCRLDREAVRTVNRLIVRCAEDFVFYPLTAPWVAGFVHKNARYRVEIETTHLPKGTGFLSFSETVVKERPNSTA